MLRTRQLNKGQVTEMSGSDSMEHSQCFTGGDPCGGREQGAVLPGDVLLRAQRLNTVLKFQQKEDHPRPTLLCSSVLESPYTSLMINWGN